MNYEENIEMLLYNLIDKPKSEKQVEFHKLNGYPSDILDTHKAVSDAEIIARLKKALENMSIIVPIMEMRNNETIVDFNDSDIFLYEHKLRNASRPLKRLRGMISASLPLSKLHSLTERYTYRSRLMETKTGSLFVVFIPITEILELGKRN